MSDITSRFLRNRVKEEGGFQIERDDYGIKWDADVPGTMDKDKFAKRLRNNITVSNIVEYSVVNVNTKKVSTKAIGMMHREGGYNGDASTNLKYLTDPLEASKYKRKQANEQDARKSMESLISDIHKKNIVRHNSILDFFETYFDDSAAAHTRDDAQTKTITLLKDPKKRTVSALDFQNDERRIATGHSCLRFQDSSQSPDTYGYVWNIENPNFPETLLTAPSPIVSLSFSIKQNNELLGGLYSGQVALWDLRDKNPVNPKSNEHLAYLNYEFESKPTISPVKDSHYDPAYSVRWVFTKTGQEYMSASTDGRLISWEKPTAPANEKEKDKTPPHLLKKTDFKLLEYNILMKKGGGKPKLDADASELYNASCFEVSSDGSNRMMVGTEQGVVLPLKKPKAQGGSAVVQGNEYNANHILGKEGEGHHGPVLTISQHRKQTDLFLSVGDWSAKIWQDETLTPIYSTTYHSTNLTGGCFSPTRQSVFYLIRDDGWLDCYDFIYRHNEVAYSHRVSDHALSTITICSETPKCESMLAIGDVVGNVNILRVGDSLRLFDESERKEVDEAFRREKEREAQISKKRKKGGKKKEKKADEEPPTYDCDKLEMEFYRELGINNERGAEQANN